MTRQQVIDFVSEVFGIQPDYPFDKEFKTAIFRHKQNRKWFGAIILVRKNKLCGKESRIVDVLDVKVDPLLKEALLSKKGIYPAYHMNKVHWVSVLLEEAEEQDVKTLLELSYALTKK
ncbi:MAG: MmcQ/YjbR family DNA-binding protein [Clostridia bacterium]|nr:MmcQ/YjbR family DNA-binding protein [Clostridia bacterium]